MLEPDRHHAVCALGSIATCLSFIDRPGHGLLAVEVFASGETNENEERFTSGAGEQLFIRSASGSASGKWFQSNDFDRWAPAPADLLVPPAPEGVRPLESTTFRGESVDRMPRHAERALVASEASSVVRRPSHLNPTDFVLYSQPR